jgi:ribosomal subunit interface protein
MHLQLVARGLHLKDSSKEYVIKKLNKINRLLNKNITVKCEIINKKSKIGVSDYFQIEVSLALPKAYIKIEERGEDILALVDKIEPILKKQIQKYKGKNYSYRHKRKFSEAMLLG